MKRRCRWLWLFNKRLYKKPAFLLLLLSVPLLLLLLNIISHQESGFVQIVLCPQDQENSLAAEVCDELKSSSELILFTECASPEESMEMVQTGQADAAWIFSEGFEQKIREFAKIKSRRLPTVTVVEREQTIPLRLSHEKLASVLYERCAQPLYLDFVRTNLAQLDDVTDQELIEDYQLFDTNDRLFIFETAETSSGGQEKTPGYLLTPVRGLLSVLILIGGLVAALFYMQEEKRGTYSWVPDAKKPLVLFLSEMIAMLNLCACVLVALYISGLGLSLIREGAALLLFAVSCSVFCMLLQQLTGKIQTLCALIPLLTVILISVCPVFFDFKRIRMLQLLFPPAYYLRAVYNGRYLLYMALYTLCLTALFFGVRKIKGGAGHKTYRPFCI